MFVCCRLVPVGLCLFSAVRTNHLPATERARREAGTRAPTASASAAAPRPRLSVAPVRKLTLYYHKQALPDSSDTDHTRLLSSSAADREPSQRERSPDVGLVRRKKLSAAMCVLQQVSGMY